MTAEEVIWYLTPIANSTSLVRYKEALGLAIDALRAQQERENPQPLTLEELRQMDGESVYLVDATGDKYSAIISRIERKGVCFILDINTEGYGSFETYGEKWTAYRHKPEERHEIFQIPEPPEEGQHGKAD